MNDTILKLQSKAGIFLVMHKHLAIFSESAVKAILSGSKTIESRFSQKRIPPFGQVNIGDIVYIKPSGRDIVGQFKVKKVISFEGLEENDRQMIRREFGRQISLGSTEKDNQFFNSHSASNYCTLISIERVEQFITSPLKFKKSDQRGWVVLD